MVLRFSKIEQIKTAIESLIFYEGDYDWEMGGDLYMEWFEEIAPLIAQIENNFTEGNQEEE